MFLKNSHAEPLHSQRHQLGAAPTSASQANFTDCSHFDGLGELRQCDLSLMYRLRQRRGTGGQIRAATVSCSYGMHTYRRSRGCVTRRSSAHTDGVPTQQIAAIVKGYSAQHGASKLRDNCRCEGYGLPVARWI